jgi:hypothetical protein
MELTNSKRLLYTASYVSTKLEEPPKAQTSTSSTVGPVLVAGRGVESSGPVGVAGDAFVKANILRSMELKSENLGQLLKAIKDKGVTEHRDDMEKLLPIAQRLNDTLRPVSTMEIAPMIAPISFDAITQLAELAVPINSNLARTLPLIYFFIDQRKKILPIGRIHLERIEMYPAGIEKGELVFSVPMAPGETTTISHKEWTTTSREFEDIVQDFFESYSERGVADKTDASMASESESKHSSSFDFGASLSGSYMGVTLTTTLGLKNTNDERESVKQSMQKNREVTEKASARSRKEHKISMKLETKMGTEDQSGKTITNPGNTAIRIDYYRMMRKWRTDLYRYGLRMTYDITIPLPGVRLWALHERLAELDKEIRTPFVFGLKPENIQSWNYREEAIKWGATVQDPPPESIVDHKYGRIEWLEEGVAAETHFGQIDIEVPSGYFISANTYPPPKLEAHLSLWGDHGGDVSFIVYGATVDPHPTSSKSSWNLVSLYGKSGRLAAVYQHTYVSTGAMEITLTYELEKEAREKWQFAAWTQLRAAAEARHREEQERLQEERDRLWRLLNGKDTLTLRRLEREELLRLVMQWLMGPDQPVASDWGVQKTLGLILENERNFQIYAENLLKRIDASLNPTLIRINEEAWINAVMFGEQVKFIQQAIEWENILYFLYPYFWGSEIVGRDKMLFEHADPEHERFLRAGYVRIVVPVRPGFEKDFSVLIETGALSAYQEHPYVTIAEDIANFAHTNYAGIPPANPEQHARPLLYPEQRATWDSMQKVMEYIEAFRKINGHYPAKLDDLSSGLPNDADGNQIVVPVDAWGNPFVYRIPGLGADYDLVSLGANNEVGGEGLNADISSAAAASLVATWFDYTPTSALDIEVVTKTEEIE